MTKKERAYIEAKIAKFDRWAEEERTFISSSCCSDDVETHYCQYLMYDYCASVLRNLLLDLEEGV